MTNHEQRVPGVGLVGLGRKPAEDERDTGFLMSSIVDEQPRADYLRYRYWWTGGWWGNQGRTPQCVAYAWLHYLEDGPITWAPRAPGEGPVVPAETVYHNAQRVDEWPGENYDGTSVRAGAKVLQQMGYIGEYRWAWRVEDIVKALKQWGPVVFGSEWTQDMFEPGEDEILSVDGRIVGGHAYLLNGVNTSTGLVRIKNSWGRNWGRRGHAYIRLEDLDRLLSHGGEACIATEKTSE